MDLHNHAQNQQKTLLAGEGVRYKRRKEQIFRTEFMESVVQSYFPVLVFFVIACLLSFIMLVVPFLIAKLKPDAEKLSPYLDLADKIGKFIAQVETTLSGLGLLARARNG